MICTIIIVITQFFTAHIFYWKEMRNTNLIFSKSILIWSLWA